MPPGGHKTATTRILFDANRAEKLATMTSPSFPTELLEANADSAADAIHQAGARATDLVAAWIKAGNASAVEAVAREALAGGEQFAPAVEVALVTPP